MHWWIVTTIGLGILSVILLIVLIVIKRQMKTIKRDLAKTRQMEYNKQIAISLVDADLTEMTMELNQNLDYQKQLKLQAEQIEQSMKQSVADIAHDLRTPLTVVKGNLQMLEREKQLSAEGKEHLAVSLSQTDALRHMVDDFFELSVLESDTSLVELQDVNVTNLIMQFIVEHEAVVRAAKLTPDVVFPEKSVVVRGEEAFIHRMMNNLLNNILKYGKDSFQIRLEVDADGQEANIIFANPVDPGLNFDVEHMFERSYQGDRSRHGSGAGLGLYIVKLLADKQGARVSAKREGNDLYMIMTFSMKKEL